MIFWLKWIFLGVLLAVSILLLGLFLYERWSRIYLPIKYPPPGQLVDVGGQLAAIGVLRLLHHLPNPNVRRIPPEMLPQLKVFAPQSTVAVEAEGQLFHRNLKRAQTTQSLGDRPLVVLTAAKPVTVDQLPRGFTQEYIQQERAVWQELQAELATLSSSSQHIISEQSGHLMYFEQPSLIIDGIHHVVDEVRRR
ncbi:MAG: hypothetical protein F6K65_13010 [Moorea sp. SIO3C2]|nr:hypothetical protein [Moorena sp. SIO3C2]